LLDSVLLLDFPVVQAVVLVTTTLVFMANQLADYAIRRVDPRIRYS
jgi:ABC-type dipeptide/oligopeptide/nickel transport system permease component